MKIHGWRARWLIAFGFWLLRIWAKTLRYHVDDSSGLTGTSFVGKFIGTIWHNRLLILPSVLRRFLPHRHGAALISASRDGDLLTDAVHRFGYNVVRGSSSKLGASALLQMSQILAGGDGIIITPDGPRGPAYELSAGVVFLAQKTGAPVIPINMEYSSCWRFKSWDRFILPRPFSRVHVVFGPLHQVAQTATPAEFEAERLRLQNAMMALVERR